MAQVFEHLVGHDHVGELDDESAAGRGPGAALGVIAVLIVGIATYVSHRVIANLEKKRTAGGVVVAEETGAAQ